jgi:hypothetical protein
MTEMPMLPQGWLVKVQDQNGDPLGRYLKVLIPDGEEALAAVLKKVPEKMVVLERNLTDREVNGMRPREIVPHC